ncbi:hypothetical protein CALCODRAFT_488844 [Calocera cornea HHB12733]|uniref:Uncharacterized protein n=1 Tax=Calocera cornea HHB12733 TaxID=1353952 RepID=A0A165C5E7_9BASI|nr:hypothetical protein CALCODRAFT_488844 [Calocera cornea HHB12733]
MTRSQPQIDPRKAKKGKNASTASVPDDLDEIAVNASDEDKSESVATPSTSEDEDVERQKKKKENNKNNKKKKNGKRARDEDGGDGEDRVVRRKQGSPPGLVDAIR